MAIKVGPWGTMSVLEDEGPAFFIFVAGDHKEVPGA